MIDRTIYFDYVRATPFGGHLKQIQVDGQTVILAVWEYQQASYDLRWLAYMLATTFHETAQKMWPIEEYGKGAGHDYAPYYGRGYVQLTWEDNYRKASDELSLYDERDLVKYPQMALDSLIAARVLYRGMIEGWFTGRKLGQYFNDTKDDPLNARQIINGNDCDDQIKGYHEDFLAALNAATVKDV